MRRRTVPWPVIAAVFWVALVSLSLWIAFLLRFDFSIPPSELALFQRGLTVALTMKLFVFFAVRQHRERWWRHLGFPDIVRIFKVNLVASASFIAVTLVVAGPGFSRSIYVLDVVLCFLLNAGARF